MAGSRSAASELAPAAEPRLAGGVEHEGRTLALALTCASRLALAVEPGAARDRGRGGVPLARRRRSTAGPLRLGRCRFTAAVDARRFAGAARVPRRRLRLPRPRRRGAVHRPARLLPATSPSSLAQRERVRPEFERWVAALVYDLSVYRRFLDDQDRIIEEEPPDVARGRARRAHRERGRARSSPSSSGRTASSTRSSRGYTQEEHERHGFYLRRMAWHFILGSEIHRRTNLKPRGLRRRRRDDAAHLRGPARRPSRVRPAPPPARRREAGRGGGARAAAARRRAAPRRSTPRSATRAPFRFLSVACGPACRAARRLPRARTTRAGSSARSSTRTRQALEAARAAIAALEAAHGPIRATTVADVGPHHAARPRARARGSAGFHSSTRWGSSTT